MNKVLLDYHYRQVKEISSGQALCFYGALLSLIHTLTYFWWFANESFSVDLSRSSPDIPALCWPYFPNCAEISIPQWLSQSVGVFYLVASLTVMALFILKRVRIAYLGLIALSLFKLSWLALDYRHMGNYHYMPFLITFCFLFLPSKEIVCRILIVGFYIAAGTLKLNNEWLSGAALFGDPRIYGLVLEWMCAYVVVLELIGVFGLLSHRSWLRWLTLTQLIVFHLFSWHIVSYFYPLVMFCLLSIFPLTWVFNRERGALSWRDLNVTAVAILILFAFAQLIPRLQSGDPALRGEGRIFALNLFDANTLCDPRIILRFRNSSTELRPGPSLAVRIRCDPLVIWNIARGECAKNLSSDEFIDLDISLSARRKTDVSFTPLIAMTDFCRKKPEYHVFRQNEWML